MREKLGIGFGQAKPEVIDRLIISRPNLGAVVSDANDGLILQNLTPSVTGLQQYGPAIRLVCHGFATTPKISQRGDFRIYPQSVQGTATITSNLLIDASTNGGAFGNILTIASGGAITFFSGTVLTPSSTGFDISNTRHMGWTSRARLKSSADGIIELSNAGETDFTRLNFGNNTNSFPGIARNGTGFDFVLADASGPTGFTALKIFSAKTTNYSVVAGDTRKVFSNVGASGTVVFTLPTAAAGLEYTFVIEAAQTLQVTAAASTTIRIAGSASSSAGNASANTVGNVLKLVATSATTWVAITTQGTWTLA